MAQLLDQEWDFVVHLSETDYPVHSLSWIRDALSQQRGSNFIPITRRCEPLPSEAQFEDANSKVAAPKGKANLDHEDSTGVYHQPTQGQLVLVVGECGSCLVRGSVRAS